MTPTIPAEVIQHLVKDPVMSGAIQKANPVLYKPEISLFEHLTRSIVSQQLSTRAAATIYGRFRAGFPTSSLLPGDVLQKDILELRSYGLSGQKAGYIQNIARHFLEKNLMEQDWHVLSDEEVINTLLPIKGVGLWTVQMILIFHLYRDDVFPIDDLVIRNRIISWYGVDGSGKTMINRLHDIAEAWRPYRSWACRYIWAAGDVKE